MDIVIKALDELKSINYSIGEVFSDEVSYIEEMCNNKKFKVVVIGEFSSGKSTFLNALVGKRILYSNMDEATGITTTIENIKNNVAIINFEDGDIKKIPIGTEENYKELSNYLNINKQDGKKVKYVDIQYSFDGIDEDIVFVDTPGLQGMSDEQLLITKEAIRDANATIMLINKKGLSQTELDLICGKNESFGRIRTKEIFILINKIGEVYDSNSDELSDEKVEKIISQVKLDLYDNGIKDSKVFAIDGLDYLHGKDTELYNNFKESKKNTSYNVLSQEEYISRSRYEEFKNELFKFLDSDNRKKAFEEDIIEKISIILEEIEELVEENLKKDKTKSTEYFDKYNKEKNMLIENRRRFINILKRHVGELSNNLSENIKEEIKSYKHSLVGNGGQVTLTIEKEINEKVLKELNKKVNKIIADTKKLIEDECKNIESNIELFYKNLSRLISETFVEEFKKMFKVECNMKFEFATQDTKIDFKFSEKEFISEYSNDIKKLKEDLKKKREDYDIDKKGKIKSYRDRYNKDINDIENDIKDIEIRYKNEKRSLGTRPVPTQRYITVERTKRKWLFFKETYYEDVPDGVDDSLGQSWDKKNISIDNNFRKEQSALYNKKQVATEHRNKYDRELIKIEIQEKELQNDEDTVKRLEELAKKDISNNKEKYIERKKEEIYILIDKYVNDTTINLYNAVEKAISDKNDSIKKYIETEGEVYLKDYQNKLENKINEIKESIRNKKVSDAYLLESINNLKDILR